MKVAIVFILLNMLSAVNGFVFRGRMVGRMGVSRVLSMSLNTGIVGLPNVGKSTLFNALIGSEMAQAANYPFCTIEPNAGLVNVPDEKLEVLGVINESVKLVPATMEFVDIAGIVKGASEGEGLGNKFLANIRQTDQIVHVVRCFVDEDVIHVDGSVDPVRDLEIIALELIFADLAQVEARLAKVVKDAGRAGKGDPVEMGALEAVKAALEEGKAASTVDLDAEALLSIKSLMLLSLKPVIYAANVSDSDLAEGNEMSQAVFAHAASEGNPAVLVSAQVESELAGLEQEDKNEFLEALGVNADGCGLKKLVATSYANLNLQTYYTSGPTETRAWTISKGMTAPQAAGVIHTDFERGFIRSETMSYDDLVKLGDEKAVKEAGKMRSEGRDYVMRPDDVCLFRFNV